FEEPDPSSYREAMSKWSAAEHAAYTAARTFLKENPPRCSTTPLTQEERELIEEQGVAAWKFEDMQEAAARTTTPLLLQTNMPIPHDRHICYFEVKLAEKPATTEVGIGIATRPYPDWRMPGFHKVSAGYLANEGLLHVNNPFEGRQYGGAFFEGDVVGICINTRVGGVLFTRNGVQQEAASTGMAFDLYPVVAANGPCTLEVNFGQSGFVFLEANIHRWGFAAVVESAAQAPPAYGSERGSILLETAPSQRS
ncbi:concanavalin A-like lectin/glucanase domain-containing protein, partial [Syncephalis pseudoplumigaleata]